jgi:3-oxoacyl-[acyl-carrier protein] reductase
VTSLPHGTPSAIVTGAGSESGIGFASAAALAAAGYQLLIAATSERIEARAETLRGAGAQILTFRGDLTDSAVAATIVATAQSAFGRVDVLVNNAGMTSVGDPAAETGIDSTTDEQWRAALARNLDSMFYVTRAVLPMMRAARYGRIVNVASVSGPIVVYPNGVGYQSAKAGVVGLTRSVAIDAAADGITANAVAPGWIATESSTPEEIAYGDATPVGRSGTADEVASLICYLASPESAYVTGQLLVVDGGNSIVEAHQTVR